MRQMTYLEWLKWFVLIAVGIFVVMGGTIMMMELGGIDVI